MPYSFISEYTGDADYLEKMKNDDASRMLIGFANKCGNIAPFINGIDNHSRKLSPSIFMNLKCVRYICTFSL
jgi:hypothetical protein